MSEVRRTAAASPARGQLTPQSRPERIPVSYAQEQLWFLDRIEKGSPQYNMLQPWRLRGPLDAAALESAVNAIVERHESLRTCVGEHDGEPYQIVLPRLEVDVPVADLTGLDPAEQTRRVMKALCEDRETGFDLAHGPLLRARLLKLADDDHVFLRNVHHIAFDGWSQEVFNRELAILYEARRQGRPAPLPPLQIQYADFAIWQQRQLGGALLDDSLAFWRRQLEGLPDRLDLATDRPRQPMQTYNGRVHETALSGAALSGLRALSAETQATLNMVLLTAFAVLLTRYSGQDDVAVGVPSANRTDLALEPLIGFFVNTLALRVRPRGGATTRQLVAAVRQAAVAAYQHQDVPFSRVVAELAPRRQLNVPPIVQVLFAMHRRVPAESRLGDLSIETIRTDELPVRYDLELHAYEHQDEVLLYWVYNRDLFDSWRIEQMARHYSHLLEHVTAHPDELLSDVPAMAAEERSRIVQAWNRPVEADLTPLADRIAAHAARTPDATAVASDGEVLTYRALDVAANRLAHALVRRGIAPGDIVAIACPRGCSMVVALVAVMKCRAAYMPLDVSYPPARLRVIVDQAAPRLALVSGGAVAALPAALPQLDLGSPALQRELTREPADAPPRVLRRPHDPAYVLYTSGSSGTPKGVVVEHSAVASFATAFGTMLPFSAGDRHVAVANLTFDISLVDLLLPLASGAHVTVAGGEDVKDVARLCETVRSACATSLQITPSHLAALVLHDPEALQGTRILAGGEPFPVSLARTLRASGAEAWNGYGPTEATVYTTLHRIRPEDLESAWPTVPIGRRLPNMRLYVLDSRLEPVPIGVQGELYVGGRGVARGYLGRADSTADRFMPDPYGPPPARMYRTGDLVRWRRDGTLEFIGRTDHQVKVRGFRIELGEIETILRAHEYVEDAVVLPRGEADARHLVAFVIPREGLASGTLRPYLQRHLPHYMVPSSFTIVDAWPLTAHGKIDRDALMARAAAAQARPEDGPALDADEAMLRTLFGDVLGRSDIGLDDDFFALGGQSLLVTRLVNRIRVRMGVEIDVRTVFEAPTVRGLAACVRGDAQHDATLTPLTSSR